MRKYSVVSLQPVGGVPTTFDKAEDIEEATNPRGPKTLSFRQNGVQHNFILMHLIHYSIR